MQRIPPDWVRKQRARFAALSRRHKHACTTLNPGRARAAVSFVSGGRCSPK
jgi:hypothetical protein